LRNNFYPIENAWDRGYSPDRAEEVADGWASEVLSPPLEIG
jgi:hypothetical protein